MHPNQINNSVCVFKELSRLLRSSYSGSTMLHHPVGQNLYRCRRLLRAPSPKLTHSVGTRHAPRARAKTRIIHRRSTKVYPITRRAVPHQLISPPASATLRPPRETFTKEISFEDFCFHKKTNVVWPKLHQRIGLHTFEETNKLLELGRNFTKYLNEVGLTDSTLLTPGTPLEVVPATNARRYYCDLEFTVMYKNETFTIALELTYQFKRKLVAPGLFVSKELLMTFLSDVLVMQKHPLTSPRLGIMKQKIKTLLKLVGLKCYINDLELDL